MDMGKKWKGLLLAGYLIAKSPRIETDLKAMGYSQRQLEAMPLAQKLLLHIAETYDDLRDGLFKWFEVPYWQAHQSLEMAGDEIGRQSWRREIVPLAAVLLPALNRVHFNAARNQRQLEALRTIQAIRLYAAAHGGKLPPALDAVEQVPIPVNPVTGGAFPYRVEGSAAILAADGPKDKPWTEYRLKMISAAGRQQSPATVESDR
jgi:hypothetical protein